MNLNQCRKILSLNAFKENKKHKNKYFISRHYGMTNKKLQKIEKVIQMGKNNNIEKNHM